MKIKAGILARIPVFFGFQGELMIKISELMKITVESLIVLSIFAVLVSGCRERSISFVVASDLHFDGTPEREMVFDTVISMINGSSEVISLNTGEKSPLPFGVFIPGDITESGKEEQWSQFTGKFGLNGEKELLFPVYETFGNHDGNADGVVRTDIKIRNSKRKGVTMISENGLHYAVKYKRSLFVVLGAYPGDEWDPNCEWCHYFKESFREPEGSLAFLRSVLSENRKKGYPVYLFFHYGWDGFSKLWWTAEEQAKFRDVLADSDIRAIFHGHDHAVESYKWMEYDVFSAGSPQQGTKTGNFLFVTSNP
ncbi:MAG: metallophosphoesterase, partial [Bacteroidales bacterium]|nr:metallophosphoesterase [Bacteroidales bacterium]